MTEKEWFENIKKSVEYDMIHNDGLMLSVSLKEMQWLIRKVYEVDHFKKRDNDHRIWLEFQDKALREIAKEGIGYGQKVAKNTLEGFRLGTNIENNKFRLKVRKMKCVECDTISFVEFKQPQETMYFCPLCMERMEDMEDITVIQD